MNLIDMLTRQVVPVEAKARRKTRKGLSPEELARRKAQESERYADVFRKVMKDRGPMTTRELARLLGRNPRSITRSMRDHLLPKKRVAFLGEVRCARSGRRPHLYEWIAE